jgi:hypothetical protein
MANTYELIAQSVLVSTTATVTFSSIPQTYSDLVIRASVRQSIANNYQNFDYTINGVTTADYDYYAFYGNSLTGPTGASSFSSTASFAGYTNAASSPANTFSNSEIYFPNYTNTSYKKPSGGYTYSEYPGSATGDSNQTAMFANLNNSTAAITSIELKAVSTTFTVNSSFYLYGIKRN